MAERTFQSREEWVLMYRSGLTQSQIALLCNVSQKLINRFIGSHRRRFPSVEFDHVANRPESAGESGPMWRLTPRWLRRREELVRFMSVHGRPPRVRASDAAERALARWLGDQRSAARNGRLHSDRRSALDGAGNWWDSARAQYDEARWHERLGLLAEFKSQEERWPSYRTRSNETERILGTWLHRQRQDAFNRRMVTEKQKLLDTAVPVPSHE